MADIKVVIQLQDTAEDEITDLGSSSEVNNASIQKTNGSFGSLSTKSDGTNMKSWANVIKDSEGNVVSKVVNGETISRGLLSLADGYVGGADTKLIEQYGYNGYVFGAVPETKQLTVTLEVRGENVDSVIIYGDTNANQFPTKAYRDGNPNDIIYSDDATWAIKFDNVASSHTITFLEWNRANYNACITYVAELKNELTLDKSWIKSVESLSQSTGQPKEIYYGAVPNSGSVDIIDINGEIFDMVNDGLISNRNVDIEIYANGKLNSSHISTNSDYSSDRIFTIENSDILGTWGEFKIVPSVRIGITEYNDLMSYFKAMMKSFGFESQYIEDMCSLTIRNGKTAKDIMRLIKIPYQYHKSNTLLDFINQICKTCQFCLSCDSQGIPRFMNGNATLEKDSILSIPKKNIYGQPRRDIIIKNKVENVKYTEASFEKNIKDICGKSFSLKDSSGNTNITTVIESIGNGNIILDDDETMYFCFFIECSDTNSEFISSLDSSIDGIFLDFKGILKGDSFEQIIQTKILEVDSSYTKENYNFTNVGANCAELTYYRTLNSKTFAIKFNIGKLAETLNKIDTISLSIMQKCIYRTIQEKVINDKVVNVFDMDDSVFMSKQTTYNNSIDIYSHNANEIINTYSQGVSVANISIGCSDIYDINGEKIKDWTKGQIVEVGDVLILDKDNNGNSLWSYKDGSPMYWKVTGRNFRKVGVPMIDLELQEVRVV